MNVEQLRQPEQERATYVHFDGMAWPNPEDPLATEWCLRWDPDGMTRNQQLVAASIISAYRQLAMLDDPERVVEKVVALRAALSRLDTEGGT